MLISQRGDESTVGLNHGHSESEVDLEMETRSPGFWPPLPCAYMHLICPRLCSPTAIGPPIKSSPVWLREVLRKVAPSKFSWRGTTMVLFELMREGEFCQGIQLSGRKERSDLYIKPVCICVKKRDCRDIYLSEPLQKVVTRVAFRRETRCLEEFTFSSSFFVPFVFWTISIFFKN